MIFLILTRREGEEWSADAMDASDHPLLIPEDSTLEDETEEFYNDVQLGLKVAKARGIETKIGFFEECSIEEVVEKSKEYYGVK